VRRALTLAFAAALAACSGSPPAPGTTLDGGAPDTVVPTPTKTDLDRLNELLAALKGEPSDPARRALVATFLHDVAYGAAGFPIRAGGKLAVVYWDPAATAGALALAGDFNGWSTSTSPFDEPIMGFPLHVRIEDDPKPAARSLYKLVRGGADWLADPTARRYGFDPNGEYSLLEPGAAAGHLERWPEFHESAGKLAARPLAVWVPPHAEAAGLLPLLVMQDGQNLFGPGGAFGSWQADDAAELAVASGDVRPFLIAGVPSSAARLDEYTPTQDTLPDLGTVGGQADAYATFVTAGVVPFVRSRYHVRPESSQTAILGSSLGGLASLYVAQKVPGVFGFAGSMSGTLSWGSIGQSNPTIRERYVAAPPLGLSLYLDSGGDDGGGCSTLSALDSELYHDQYCETVRLRDTLLGLGWTMGKDLGYAWAPGAAHSEAEWKKRFPDVLRGWFPKK